MRMRLELVCFCVSTSLDIYMHSCRSWFSTILLDKNWGYTGTFQIHQVQIRTHSLSWVTGLHSYTSSESFTQSPILSVSGYKYKLRLSPEPGVYLAARVSVCERRMRGRVR